MYRGETQKRKISQNNRCLRPDRTENFPLLLELNYSVGVTGSRRPHRQSFAHCGSPEVGKDFGTLTAFLLYLVPLTQTQRLFTSGVLVLGFRLPRMWTASGTKAK